MDEGAAAVVLGGGAAGLSGANPVQTRNVEVHPAGSAFAGANGQVGIEFLTSY